MGNVYKDVPFKEDIKAYIKENEILQSHNYICPHCVSENNKYPVHEDVRFTGSFIMRNWDSGYDWIEILECPRTNKLYWYLNGV